MRVADTVSSPSLNCRSRTTAPTASSSAIHFRTARVVTLSLPASVAFDGQHLPRPSA